MRERPADARASVRWSEQRGLAVLRLHREHGNAIDERLVEDLLAAVARIEAAPGVRGAMLAAEGRIFCPGLDLRELLHYDRVSMERFMRRFGDCLLALYSLSKPLLVAISGHALAGGCVLALTGDWRVVQRGARVGLNELRVGLPLPYGVAQILRASIPPHRLTEVALLGRNYEDEEAVAAGLAHEVHAPEGFEAHCLARLEELSSREPRTDGASPDTEEDFAAAFSATKRALRLPTIERLRRDPEHLGGFLDRWFSEATRRRIAGIVAQLEARSRPR